MANQAPEATDGAAPDTVETQAQRAAQLKAKEEMHKMRRIVSTVIQQQDRHGKPTLAARIYLHPAFENAALGLIIANSVWIGVDIDWNGRPGARLTKTFFQVGESLFCFLFLSELCIRVLAYKRTEMFFYDPVMQKWNLFDSCLVFFMVMDTWVLAYVIKTNSQELQLLSTFRLVRLLRMTRMLRLVPELGMMVKSMIAAVRSVASTCALALGIMYVFAILLTQWTKSYGSQGKCIGFGQYLCIQDYFGTIALSFLSLMQILVFDDTFEIIRPIMSERWTYGCLLVLYILLVSFTVLNMLIGIICDIVSETTAKEREKQLQRRIEEIFMDMDIDESGTLTRDEFEGSDAMESLEALGIESHVCKNAFDILDVNRDGHLASAEFVRMIFKCLHPPHAEEILELEARVDKIADVVGLGRKAIAVLDKERGPKRMFSAGKVEVIGGHLDQSEMASTSPWMASVEAAAEKAARKHRLATEAIAEKASDEREYSDRLRALGWKLGDVLLLAEAGTLGPAGGSSGIGNPTNFPGGGRTPAPPGTLMLDNAPAAAAMARNSEWQGGGTAPAPPGPGLMTILRPALRALDARLHALRAECKAANMKNAGNLAGIKGEDKIPRASLQPLDELISEVLQRLDVASKALRPPGAAPPLPPATSIRQRDMLHLEDRSGMQSRGTSRDVSRRHRSSPREPSPQIRDRAPVRRDWAPDMETSMQSYATSEI